MALFLGAVADDDTGATDLGNMLANQGMQAAVVTFGDHEALRVAAQDCDAIIVGTASRSVAKDEAYRRTREAVRELRQAGARRMLIKYCSTFDSTPQGNIGASIDAAMDEMNVSFTLALPAQPSLGRTTYMGYHFVHQQLLSDSPMRRHPLTPMTNPNLISHLSTQTSRSVGLLPFGKIRSGVLQVQQAMSELQQAACNIALCDCVDEMQLACLGEAAADMELLTGSSAWGMVLPSCWKAAGQWIPIPASTRTRTPGGNGVLCVSGSCSVATERQIAWARANNLTVIECTTSQLLSAPSAETVDRVVAKLSAGEALLVTTQPRDTASHALDDAERVSLGEHIAAGLAHLVQAVMQRQTPAGLVVAGGETSSTMMRALNLGGVKIGDPIEHGVPLCTALHRPSLALALKSGNFGSDDFFGRAIDAVRRMPVMKQESA